MKTKTMIQVGGFESKLPGSVANICSTFKGLPLSVVEEEKYLSIVKHSWKDICHAAKQRASGCEEEGACHGM